VPLSHAEALWRWPQEPSRLIVQPTIGQGHRGGARPVHPAQGLNLITITIAGDPSALCSPLMAWARGHGDEAFEARELAIGGLPAVEEVKVTNAALEALLDTWRGGADHAQSRAPNAKSQRMPAPSAALAPAEPPLDTSSLPAPPASFTPERPTPPLSQEVVNDDMRPHRPQPCRMRVLDPKLSWMRLPRTT
jgi:hypothetical protein